MLFFPAFVNGPIVSHVEFEQRKLDWFWAEGERPGLLATLRDQRVALRRAVLGLALGVLTMTVIYAYRDSLYTSATRGQLGWPNALYTYTWWYLAFTAWTEAAIGLARLSGIHLPENFDAPHFSYGPADFWRRWNMTFMVWLRRYVYLPLGGAFVRGWDGERHLEWRNTAAVFGVVAAYHLLGGLKLLGPYWYSWTSCIPWLFWAVLNTVGVLATRSLKRPSTIGPAAALVMVATLLFASFGHMSAQYPPNAPIAGMWTLLRGMLWPW
jgi:D-alanyl-lipoteichoic acid acyltransferase DltB (MBOAT superfamily)